MNWSQKSAKKIQSLQQKKFRQKYGQFVVEGEKAVNELLTSDWEVECVLCTTEIFPKYQSQFADKAVISIAEKEMQKLSNHRTAPPVLAVVDQRNVQPPDFFRVGKWYIALDDIRDPGNLGTIIRIADWYGIDGIWCSENCVELYNPKVISATMASFLRIPVCYGSVNELKTHTHLPLYGMSLDGHNIRQMAAPDEGIIVIGNESKGLGSDWKSALDESVFIPRFGEAESLNAAIATAVVCDRWR